MSAPLTGEIEARPGRDGRSTVSWPSDWGAPPPRAAERHAWIKYNVLDGQLRSLQGENVPWVMRPLEHRITPGLEMSNRPRPTTRRAASVGAGATIGGLGVVFNVPSSDMGFVEIWSPDAFSKQFADNDLADVKAQAEHNFPTLASISGRTLRLTQRRDGIYYEIDVPDSQPYIAEAIGRGDITGSSFTFITLSDRWTSDADGYPVRFVDEARLLEIGPVSWPAFPQTTAEIVRSGSRSLQAMAEARVGKKLSAASLEKIQAAMSALRELLGGDDDGSDDETLLDQALEMDSVDDALELYAVERALAARQRRYVDERMIEHQLAHYETQGILNRLG